MPNGVGLDANQIRKKWVFRGLAFYSLLSIGMTWWYFLAQIDESGASRLLDEMLGFWFSILTIYVIFVAVMKGLGFLEETNQKGHLIAWLMIANFPAMAITDAVRLGFHKPVLEIPEGATTASIEAIALFAAGEIIKTLLGTVKHRVNKEERHGEPAA